MNTPKQPKFNYQFALRGSIPSVGPQGAVKSKKKAVQKPNDQHKFML